ncbi:uncharacterized protein AB675_6491 [Cyphellophora attinorum]|uniref:Uncharacterized protein n=1 Tax=Cyphellophora attinorum TaxID=1664694 RepID=A0A0N1P3G2_9EURO|nr:uncharacterized protein AB675_6491 [Phialophora attinorum]KPI43930.1 hypothetical protein AB675_6491 [Phialophora attinorum]
MPFKGKCGGCKAFGHRERECPEKAPKPKRNAKTLPNAKANAKHLEQRRNRKLKPVKIRSDDSSERLEKIVRDLVKLEATRSASAPAPQAVNQYVLFRPENFNLLAPGSFGGIIGGINSIRNIRNFLPSIGDCAGMMLRGGWWSWNHRAPAMQVAAATTATVASTGTTVLGVLEEFDCQISSASRFFSVPKQDDPHPQEADEALEFARLLCEGAPALWVPLLFHALCLPNFRRKNKKVSSTVHTCAWDTVLQSGVLSVCFPKLATTIYKGAGNVQDDTLNIFDFLAPSNWRPGSCEYASPHVLMVYRGIQQLGETLNKSMENRLRAVFKFPLSSYGCLLWDIVKEPQLRTLVAMVEQQPNIPAVFDAIAKSMGLDEFSVHLGRTYMRLKHTFLAQRQVSLTWFHRRIKASEARVACRSATESPCSLWQTELQHIFDMIQDPEWLDPQHAEPTLTQIVPISPDMHPAQISDEETVPSDATSTYTVSADSTPAIGTPLDTAPASIVPWDTDTADTLSADSVPTITPQEIEPAEIISAEFSCASTVTANSMPAAIIPSETDRAESMPSGLTAASNVAADSMPAVVTRSATARADIVSTEAVPSRPATAEIFVESKSHSSTTTKAAPGDVVATLVTTEDALSHESTIVGSPQAESLSDESSKQKVAEANIVSTDVVVPAGSPPGPLNDDHMSGVSSSAHTEAGDAVTGKRKRTKDGCDAQAQPLQKKARQSVMPDQDEAEMVQVESDERSETASPLMSVAKLRGDSIGSVDSGIGMGRTL